MDWDAPEGADDDGLLCAVSASTTHHWVYKAYDADDQLLYVGITRRGHRRLAEHARFSGWRTRVTTIQIEHHPDRVSALEREAHLIRSERPPFNIMLNRPVAPTTRSRRGDQLPDPDPAPVGLMTLRDVGILLSVGDSVIERCIKTDGLPASWDAGRYLVDPDDLEVWIESRKSVSRNDSPYQPISAEDNA